MFTEELAGFIRRTNYEDIPKETLDVAKKAILDNIACTMSGSQEPSGRIIMEMVKESGAPAEATVIGGRFKSSAALAALANGTSAHTQDYDDCLDFPTAGLAHPTAGTFSGLLTMGEKNHWSGKDIITAYCLGVEAYGKIGLMTVKGGGAGNRGWEWTGTLGIIGGTVGLSKLLDFNEEQIVNAIGTASTMAGCLIRNFGSFAGHLHGGLAARDAINTAILVQKGYDCTGNDPVEGHNGYFNAFSGIQDPLPEEEQREKLDMLGNPWSLVSPSLMFKYYPCAHISHFGVWAGQQLHAKYDFDWHDIEGIEFRQPSLLGRNTTPPYPQNGVQGRFSMAYCLCRSLIHDGVDFWMFKDDTVEDADTHGLFNKLTFSVMEEQEDRKLVFGYQEVVLRMKDGSVLNYEIDHPKGEPQNPQTPEELQTKFVKCAKYADYSDDVITQVRNMVADFDNIKDINELTELLGQ
ncbi:MAG: MmgE/PrpD family protein [Dehalococcoidales bacterium]|nr:MmgE/PrpD family protein [Dehalococcoidales bacterium]